jgi:hypothetical protein
MLLTKQNLQIAKLAPNGASRYTLNGILVTPTKTVVTDGHCMVIVEASNTSVADFPLLKDGSKPAETFAPFILSASAALEVAKSIPTKSPIEPVKRAAVGATSKDYNTLVTTDLDTERKFTTRSVNGQFPSWSAALPQPDKFTLKTTLGLDVIVPVLTELKSMGVEKITLRLQNEENVLQLDGVIKDTGQKVTALVMPYNPKSAVELNTWTVDAVPAPAPTETEQVPVEVAS